MTASSHSVNLISTAGQSVNGAAEGSATPGFKMIPLMTNPSPGFHEYRFDWLPSGVGLFVDGAFITQISDPNVIPKTPGMLAVSHRSDCNPLSSGEPPAQDSVLTVSYIQAYFNTTTGAGASAAAKKDACPSNGQCVVANLNPKNATSSPMGLMAPVQPNAVNATGSSATGSGAQSSATAQGPAGSLAVDARFVVAVAMASVAGLCGFW